MANSTTLIKIYSVTPGPITRLYQLKDIEKTPLFNDMIILILLQSAGS
jgi:hypothetical protein